MRRRTRCQATRFDPAEWRELTVNGVLYLPPSARRRQGVACDDPLLEWEWSALPVGWAKRDGDRFAMPTDLPGWPPPVKTPGLPVRTRSGSLPWRRAVLTALDVLLIGGLGMGVALLVRMVTGR